MAADIIEPKPGVDVGRITGDMHVENADDGHDFIVVPVISALMMKVRPKP